MTFKNEHVPKREDETSTVLQTIRTRLRLGFLSTDKWTVDRERELVLVRTGRGNDIESKHDEYWSYFEFGNHYRLHTELLDSYEISKTIICMKRRMAFGAGDGFAGEPDNATLLRIKEALTVYKDYGVISAYESAEIVLVNHKGEAL